MKESQKASEEALRQAFEMYRREHTRWNHWAIFFFGFLVSVFVVQKQLGSSFPLWGAALMASVITILWVFGAQSIRAHTWAWRETVKQIEDNSHETAKAYALFETKISEFSRWRDFGTTLAVWRTDTWRSITRIIILLSVLVALFFFALAVYTFQQ